MYYGNLEASICKESLSEHECSFTRKVNINGIVFKWGMWMPFPTDCANDKVSQIQEICDIFLVKERTVDAVFVVCKTYTVKNNDNNVCYIVDKSSVKKEYTITSIHDYLKHHHYPVKLHKLNGQFMFRCKRF